VRTSASSLDEQYSVVHGHFHLNKYKGQTRDEVLIVFLRDPIARTISHYNYWLQRESSYKGGNSLRDRFHRDKMDIVEFAAQPEIRGIYSNFLSRTPLDELAFIGVTECYSESVSQLSVLLGCQIPEYHERASDSRSSTLATKQIDALTALSKESAEIYREAQSQFIKQKAFLKTRA